MTSIESTALKTMSFHRRCFACGMMNDKGLRLQFVTTGTTTTGTVVISNDFQGYEGMAQGGIVATILDSAMVRLLHDLFGENPVTGKLDVRYLSPTPLRKPVTVSARIVKRRGTMYWAEAEIIDQTTRCATATGIFKLLKGLT